MNKIDGIKPSSKLDPTWKYSNHMFDNLKNPLQNHTKDSIKLIQLTKQNWRFISKLKTNKDQNQTLYLKPIFGQH